MPIRLTCSACNKPMQAPDTAAGKRVKCPNCQAVVSVPAAAPAAPPPPARPAAPPVPPPAPKAAVPPPPAPAAPAAAAAPANDNPFGFDDAPVKKPKAASRADRDEDEDEDERPSKKRGRDRRDRDDRDDDEDWEGEAPRKGAKGWAAFGSGCGMVKIGVWIEFAAVAYFSILFLLAAMGIGGRSPLAGAGGAIFLPIPLLMLAGTGFVLLGRMSMMSVPKTTGAGTVLLGAVLLTGLRGIAVLLGAVFAILALTSDGMAMAMYGSRAFLALGIAAAPGVVAELTVITAMALAGGCIPDENVRRKSGLLTFVTQMFALAYFLLVGLVLLVGMDDMGGRGRGPRGPGGPPVDPQVLITVIVLVYLLLQFVYTALQASMYGAAQSAIAGYNRKKPKFDDEE